MPQATVTIYLSVGGISVNGAVRRTASGQISHQVSLAAGKAGSLTTRTDNDTGVVTLGEGHGILTNDQLSVCWAGGARLRMIATVAGNLLTIDGGTGDNLPAQNTAVVVQKLTSIDTDFDGDLLEIIAACCTTQGIVGFYDAANVLLAAIDLAEGEPWFWASDSGIANPLAGNPVAYALVGNGDDAAGTFSLGALYNST
jgi:hypothetical protein